MLKVRQAQCEVNLLSDLIRQGSSLPEIKAVISHMVKSKKSDANTDEKMVRVEKLLMEAKLVDAKKTLAEANRVCSEQVEMIKKKYVKTKADRIISKAKGNEI